MAGGEMFKKILIANRGEIACRVIKTAKRLGVATVAVYSQADRDALHVEMADEAVAIGPPAASESYLVIDKIVEAARQTGAEAVHPGYGFLSENAGFAKALAKAGIAFVGPNVYAIEMMGDKIASKKLAAEAGVNTVPGYLGVIKDAEEAAKIANDIGYPVMIKASAGGGGKGMRVARSANEVAEGFESSMSEARSSFGDDRVFIEKFIEQPRHIEIQVLADKKGNIVHLGERECSIQRRNQKVIEEAPSSFLDEKTRAAMGEQAVALAKSVSYESAGTVEFIVDGARNFYFLEMNTRLQVEHPVTELITGIDLVEQMLRIAAGATLDISQNQVALEGWAIESRIYAEDPFRNFLPSTGRLKRYRAPLEGRQGGLTVRNDTGVAEGGEISIYYDPMIAKLVTHGPDRRSAIRHMSRALDGFFIDGISHNIPFLSALMEHPRWRSGDISTEFIAQEYGEGFQPREADDAELRLLAAIAASIDHVGNRRRRGISQQMVGSAVRFAENRVVLIGDRGIELRICDGENGEFRVRIEDGSAQALQLRSDWWPGEPVWQGRVDDQQIAVQVRPLLNGHALAHRGIRLDTYVYTRREAELARLMPVREPPDTSKMLLCPMPGMLTALHVAVGDEVKAGDSLCTVEAMKMENILRAERDGVVKAVNAETGDSLAVDAVILEFE